MSMPVVEWKYGKPQFSAEVVEDCRNDGYWVEALPISGSGGLDLMTFGVNLGDVFWHRNPDWERSLVAKLRMPVGMAQADIRGTGRPDPLICYEIYGEGGTIEDPDPNGGKISWFENPGTDSGTGEPWRAHYIGQSTGMHRIRIGHYTQREKWEVLGFPIALEEVHAIVPIVMFTQPDDVLTASEWVKSSVDESHFRVIHDAESAPGLIPGSDLDSVVIASERGVDWLYFDEAAAAWKIVPIGVGERSIFEATGFKGSGNAAVGRIGDDPFAYVVAQEPFHGNTVAVYCKDSDGSPGEVNWRRHVLDVYGDPNDKGEGTGHHVVCADFDNDGDDEVLVALRGPWPWKGVFYYKAVDLEEGVFAKWRVSSESAARIAIGDFNQDGRPDFATIGYSVRGYYVEPNPKVIAFINEMDY
jgi:hypothetical protein